VDKLIKMQKIFCLGPKWSLDKICQAIWLDFREEYNSLDCHLTSFYAKSIQRIRCEYSQHSKFVWRYISLKWFTKNK